MPSTPPSSATTRSPPCVSTSSATSGSTACSPRRATSPTSSPITWWPSGTSAREPSPAFSRSRSGYWHATRQGPTPPGAGWNGGRPAPSTRTCAATRRSPTCTEPTPSGPAARPCAGPRSEEHTSELQSHSDLVCRLLLEKKKHTAWERCGANAYYNGMIDDRFANQPQLTKTQVDDQKQNDDIQNETHIA